MNPVFKWLGLVAFGFFLVGVGAAFATEPAAHDACAYDYQNKPKACEERVAGCYANSPHDPKWDVEATNDCIDRFGPHPFKDPGSDDNTRVDDFDSDHNIETSDYCTQAKRPQVCIDRIDACMSDAPADDLLHSLHWYRCAKAYGPRFKIIPH